MVNIHVGYDQGSTLVGTVYLACSVGGVRPGNYLSNPGNYLSTI